MAIPPARKALLGALTALLVMGAGATALAVPRASSAASASASAVDMPTTVEDFTHPGAARLKETRGITLKRGDGHLWLTDATALGDCQDASNVAVEARNGVFCFKTNAKSGYLTLELPDTFSLWTQDHPVKATLSADGRNTVVNAPANDLTPVGEGAGAARSVLVEIRITG
ncbi:hypothetical protein OG285_05615 [Streptomyces sp. NBC_01471]|uniref:hypothetical protein n=1 Tax=Streptomyces sp. NBC_01471 TaxID=2903879 RepID=UPI00324B3843